MKGSPSATGGRGHGPPNRKGKIREVNCEWGGWLNRGQGGDKKFVLAFHWAWGKDAFQLTTERISARRKKGGGRCGLLRKGGVEKIDEKVGVTESDRRGKRLPLFSPGLALGKKENTITETMERKGGGI